MKIKVMDSIQIRVKANKSMKMKKATKSKRGRMQKIFTKKF